MPVACPSENVGCTAYEPTGSSVTTFTSRLPVWRTSCPGPWPRTSADGENTRRNSYGSENDCPSEKAISSTRDFWCSLISVGDGVALIGPASYLGPRGARASPG